MTRMTYTRRALVLAITLVVAVLAPLDARASHPTRLQPFYADSGDNCRYGFTQGTLWFDANHPPQPAAVNLSGSVNDRPLPGQPSTVCSDDRRYTVATFTAYAGTTVINSQQVRADNGSVPFRITLGDGVTLRIDRAVIQVCRFPLRGTWIPAYCGRPQSYVP
jgi:hypothetical protein